MNMQRCIFLCVSVFLMNGLLMSMLASARNHYLRFRRNRDWNRDDLRGHYAAQKE